MVTAHMVVAAASTAAALVFKLQTVCMNTTLCMLLTEMLTASCCFQRPNLLFKLPFPFFFVLLPSKRPTTKHLHHCSAVGTGGKGAIASPQKNWGGAEYEENLHFKRPCITTPPQIFITSNGPAPSSHFTIPSTFASVPTSYFYIILFSHLIKEM